MAEILHQNQHNESDNEQSRILREIDRLGVLSSTQAVVEQGEYVWIQPESIERLCTHWIGTPAERTAAEPAWYDRYHFQDGTERTLHWLLVLDALNFCFWAEKDQPRWQIMYKGELLNGYWAEAAALTQAVEEGIPLWDAVFLSTLNRETLAHIFRSEPAGIPIPLFEERLNNVHEVGHVLLERYNGHFSHALEEANKDAVKLALLLAQNFSSFNDVTSYRTRTIRFFKRAQLCVADIHGAFHGQAWGEFHNIDDLTAFADYKLPQVLRHAGVLEYHPTLAERVDNQQLIAEGEEAEIEIRAATIWACELLRREMIRLGHPLTAAQIDQQLWHMGQNSINMRPYHRTRTIYY